MPLTRTTGIKTLTGAEDFLFTPVVGTTDKHFQSSINLSEMASGDNIEVKVYKRCDGVSYFPFDSDVTDYKGSNNGTVTYHTNLKALLKFEQNVNDSTSGANNGTVTGTATYISGQEGSAFSFNGSTSISLANETNFDFERTNAFSVSFWMKTSTSATMNIISKNNTSSPFPGYEIKVQSNKLRFKLNNDNITNWIQVDTTTSVNDGTWKHIIVTYDGSSTAAGCKIYINGVSDSLTTVNDSLSASILNNNSVVIGAFSNGTSSPYTGYLDELRIYNIQLSASQVSALYMVGKYGQSHTFDGGEYITLANESNFDFERTSSFSVATWFKTSDTGVTSILQKGTFGVGWYVIMDSTKPGLMLRNTDTTNEIRVKTSSAYNDGTWHHLCITYDGSSSATGVKIYIDGSAVSTTTVSNTLSSTILNNTSVTVGGNTLLFTGQLDDVRIYDRALSSTDVTDLYTNPASLKSLVYDRTYSGAQSSPLLYIPFIQSVQYAVSLTQSAGNYYKTVWWEYYTVT